MKKTSTKRAPTRRITLAEAVLRHAAAVEKLAAAETLRAESEASHQKAMLNQLGDLFQSLGQGHTHPTGSFDGNQLREDLEALKKIQAGEAATTTPGE